MVEVHLVAHGVDLLQALVRCARDLEIDEALDRLVRGGCLGVVGDHAVVLVALDVLEMPVGEVVVGVGRGPVAAHVVKRALARLLLGLADIHEAGHNRFDRLVACGADDLVVALDILGHRVPAVQGNGDQHAQAQLGHAYRG